MNLLNDSALI